MLELIESFKEFATSPGVMLFGAVTLIEIVPIKVNPWQWVFSWIGKVINAEDRKNIQEMRKDLNDLKRDFEEDKAKEKRWHILDFVNSTRHGRKHTREEWNHVISELAAYEVYTEEKNIKNGVIEEDAKYLRALYQECNKTNDFL